MTRRVLADEEGGVERPGWATASSRNEQNDFDARVNGENPPAILEYVAALEQAFLQKPLANPCCRRRNVDRVREYLSETSGRSQHAVGALYKEAEDIGVTLA